MAVPTYTIDPRTGRTIVIYPDGTVQPVLGAESYDPMAAGAGGTVPGPRPETITSDAPAESDPDRAPAARSYRPRPPRGDDAAGGSTLPAYADGSRHPAGGGFARLDVGPGGADTREQLYLPTGAAAGPFSTRAPRTPATPARGGDADDGGGGGGAGSALYHAWRDKLMGAAYPGGGSSSYASSSYGYKPPKEEKERMRGPYARGLDPEQALGLALRPTAMIPRALPGLDSATPLYESLANLPAYQLAILSKRGYKGRPRDVANSLGRFYADAGIANDLPDFDTVFRNLTNPKKGGGVDQLFRGVKNPAAVRRATGYQYEYGKEPLLAGEAAATYEGLLDAALSLLPTETAAKYSSYADGLIDKATLKTMKKPAGKGKTINRLVGRRLFR